MQQYPLHPPGLRKVTLAHLPPEYDHRVHQSEGSPAERARAGATPLSPISRWIIVIDDSPTIRKVVETTLQREGYQVRSFPNAVSALDWLLHPATVPPAIIFVDIVLPEPNIDGYDILCKLKARPRFAQTACIVLSRRDGMVDKLKGRLAGAKGYVTKPFTKQMLLDTVRTYLPGESAT